MKMRENRRIRGGEEEEEEGGGGRGKREREDKKGDWRRDEFHGKESSGRS